MIWAIFEFFISLVMVGLALWHFGAESYGLAAVFSWASGFAAFAGMVIFEREWPHW